MMLLDIGAPSTGAIAAGAGIVFLVILAAVSYIAFRIFRKTLKMAFRMAILASVLVAVVGGGVGLWWFGTSRPSSRSVPQRTR
jgi:phosphoglycerol transferase MdoB-like AlkP superfamily enzyme